MNSHRFKLYRAYSISFTSSNVGKYFWSWSLKDCIKVQEKERNVFPSSTEPEFRHFHVVVEQWGQRNVKKGVMHVQSCCFANLKSIACLPFSLPPASSLLKLPNYIKTSTLTSKTQRNKTAKVFSLTWFLSSSQPLNSSSPSLWNVTITKPTKMLTMKKAMIMIYIM